jgi:hypothetical protein
MVSPICQKLDSYFNFTVLNQLMVTSDNFSFLFLKFQPIRKKMRKYCFLIGYFFYALTVFNFEVFLSILSVLIPFRKISLNFRKYFIWILLKLLIRWNRADKFPANLENTVEPLYVNISGDRQQCLQRGVPL